MLHLSAIAVETWYCWREFVSVESPLDGSPPEPPRLLIPWSDPYQYEYPFDGLWKTAEEAKKAKEECAPNDTWVLCKETIIPIEVIDGEPEEEETHATAK